MAENQRGEEEEDNLGITSSYSKHQPRVFSESHLKQGVHHTNFKSIIDAAFLLNYYLSIESFMLIFIEN